MSETYTIDDLLAIMAKLRDPEGGCPWDIEQNFETIAPYTIEEAYEVDEAIRADDMASLKDELGDLLFQTVFHAQMAKEAGHFDFASVVQNVSEKMVRRHPHVFGDASIEDADAQTSAWEAQKARERAEKAEREGRAPSVLDGVSLSLPALLRAVKLQKRAARVGFDWPETLQVLDKMQEESAELVEEYKAGADPARIREEYGDLLFVVANLGRHLKVDPEEALRDANAKFTRRFHRIEALLAADGRTPSQSNLEEMDSLWDQAKAEEKAAAKETGKA
ncbi:nucleoside triphosphate pyrophosphohydrolase [Kordiimonas marina]|uniref:nucleoside triphosphate pyrophosphohydrolase n=1 Tax=Kordiimonas marina TaxID=2872312 RepID=UPI001FF6EE97|nr:nucleoside triphosphate pyrophosphohydrolase [Kordiimonas marina]MCJ9428802.1 nucleoside triphosphate pyrophosphohydrolase [Kordiimonas marina]